MSGRFSRFAISTLLILSLYSFTSAQQGQKASLRGDRDKVKEDAVAKLLETIRADAKIPSLTRIRHRDSLEEGICSIAQAGSLGNRQSGDRAAFYKTSTPESISSELEKVASFNKVGPNSKLAYPRFSVAVWQVKDSQKGETVYWVGVERYPSALEELV